MLSRLALRDKRSGRLTQRGLGPDRSVAPPKTERIHWDVVALHAAVISGLLIISVVSWWGVWVTGHPTSTLACRCGDESGAVDALALAPWALVHGHSPFFSNAIFAGQGGVNMLTNTTWIAGSLLFSPVTWLFGPIATFNVVVTLAPVASGWCCFFAVRKFFSVRPGSDRGGHPLWVLGHHCHIGTSGPPRFDLALVPAASVRLPLRLVCDQSPPSYARWPQPWAADCGAILPSAPRYSPSHSSSAENCPSSSRPSRPHASHGLDGVAFCWAS